MSNVNVKRVVENIRANTTVYTPIVEAVVNAIQAIDAAQRKHGEIFIRIQRAGQSEIDGTLPDVCGIEVADNGIGFTDENRESFDTLYSEHKSIEGGKGFGRFTCLKYFENVRVVSVYETGSGLKQRVFSMGKNRDIIINERISATVETESRTSIFLDEIKNAKQIDKKLSTIAKHLVEKLLPYFIIEGYVCPRIVLSEQDGIDPIRLNDFVENQLSAVIKELSTQGGVFKLKSSSGDEEFVVRVFKIYFPKNQKSRISLVAHKREVSGSAIQKYIPEFSEEFYEKGVGGEENRDRNYIIKAYVFSDYLDRNVSLERGGFEFQSESDALLGISEFDIEAKSAAIARSSISGEITSRLEKKRAHVQAYVDEEAPWHKVMLQSIDVTALPYNPSTDDIESYLQREKFSQEAKIKKDVSKLLADGDLSHLHENVLEVVNKISETSKNDLTHYIALRRNILDIFRKSLEVDNKGSYESEGVVHDIIFPRHGSTDVTAFEKHNLWLIDERLNFTNYVSSDVALNGGLTDRPDLLVYDKRILFRGDNVSSNPITIFEFKKPQRHDFVNPSSKEDPVQQIVRYVNSVRDGEYKTPEGRKILVADNTPFYGYVVCDLPSKVERWLEREKNFKPMPDRLGWFQWFENINLYVEVISWDKVLNDAKMRNQIFFQKLGI